MVDVVDRASLHREMEDARLELRRLLATATTQDLRRGTSGTRWTNAQLLYHVVFGYVIVRTLLPLVRTMSRAPDAVSRGFAALQHSLETEAEATLHRGMHFPTGWDPYFRDVMTVADVYHFGTQHFTHHRRQLSLDLDEQ